jgi:uncharacterized protein YndB with AHSA1/START domain
LTGRQHRFIEPSGYLTIWCITRGEGKDVTDRNDTSAETTDRELAITRIFDAPRDLVFRVWTRPEHLVRWWGPRDFTTPSCKMDLRPGGAYRTCIRSPRGTELWMQGVYREVVEPERLVLTFAWEDEAGRPGHETLVTVTFADHGGKTKLTFRQAVFESVADRDSHRAGWSAFLDRLAQYLASGPGDEIAPD